MVNLICIKTEICGTIKPKKKDDDELVYFVENFPGKQGITHGDEPATVLTRHFTQEIGTNTNCPLWQWIGSVILSME